VVPLKIIRERTTALAILASLAVGMAMFGGAVFLGQYFQIGRGYSPTEAGLLTIPLMAGVLVSSTISGRLISATGRIKPYIVAGTIILVGGFAVLATMDHQTSLWFVGTGMALVGIGVGMSMQNLVLSVQNTVRLKDIGAASSTVAFFRSLGGTIGVSVRGAVLAGRRRGDGRRRHERAESEPTAGRGRAHRPRRLRRRDRPHLPDLGGDRRGRRGGGRAHAADSPAYDRGHPHTRGVGAPHRRGDQ
jgi:hypothetical protein